MRAPLAEPSLPAVGQENFVTEAGFALVELELELDSEGVPSSPVVSKGKIAT